MKSNTEQDYKVNDDITSYKVRITKDGVSKIMLTSDALILAEKLELDLVMINGSTEPPICNILDFNKFKYMQKMKAKKAAKSQRENKIVIKEVQFKPNISNNDLNTKCNQISKFISKGFTVKVQVQFKGRERQRTSVGFDLINKVVEIVETAVLENPPQLNGNKIIAIFKGIPNGV